MQRLRNSSGFSLIELLVAAIVGLGMVTGAGLLGLNIFHQRASYDSISAATSLAERQFEILRAIQNPVSNSNFTDGDHTATNSPMNPNGTSGGQFVVEWNVRDDIPMVGVKKITMRVTHLNNPAVDVQLVTYYKVS